MTLYRNTPDYLAGIQEELSQREPLFHRPAFDMSREALEALIDASFWEVGASGRCYDRAFVIDTILQRAADPADDAWESRDFYCQELAPDHYLLTYTLHQETHITRRASIWRWVASGWRIVYH